MFEKIANIINAWDPLSVFPYAPNDEYDLEISELVRFLEENHTCTEERLGEKIYELFLRSLGDDIFLQSIEDCKNIAKQILN